MGGRENSIWKSNSGWGRLGFAGSHKFCAPPRTSSHLSKNIYNLSGNTY